MRFLMKLVFLFTLLFAACIGLIRAQPYDDSELRAFLTPDDCPMPCIMGIRPGVTTMEEAMAILESHESVILVNNHTVVNNQSVPPKAFGDITWEWSGLQPSLIDKNVVGQLWIDQGQVARMSIGTRIRLGDIWQLLGQPQHGDVFGSDTDDTLRALQATYTNIPLGIEAISYCPINATTFWQAPLRIIAGSHYGPNEEFRLAYPRC